MISLKPSWILLLALTLTWNILIIFYEKWNSRIPGQEQKIPSILQLRKKNYDHNDLLQRSQAKKKTHFRSVKHTSFVEFLFHTLIFFKYSKFYFFLITYFMLYHFKVKLYNNPFLSLISKSTCPSPCILPFY